MGWWGVVFNKNTGRVQIQTQSNQDPITGALVPLLGIDVWEHAYYLDYKNDRMAYLQKIWEIINWTNVQQRFGTANNK